VIETACNSKSVDEDFYPDKLPSDVAVYRHYNNSESKFGPGLWTPDVVGVYLCAPSNTNMRTIAYSVLKVLRINKVDCYIKGNDLYFIKDDKHKKFLGLMDYDWENDWTTYHGMFSFKIDIELLNNIIRFDKDKFTKKEEFKSN